ncbi:hypothetical protein [Saccharibacillus kuerlensis]|uniref:Uncharacterized protein n=1 Tax=Saccharibacillus kuerlensis TaxID=459527 RepID=A0ABQ2KS41_9BACL|nr:hypothetical protein [Saccharibacillus kuerlensis]GGN91157.1 hypothetical protein GCM10010969_02480 [Saccharibacillus kuerlensis]
MKKQDEGFFEKEEWGGRIMLLYIRYACLWVMRRLSADKRRYDSRLKRLQSVLDDAKKIRMQDKWVRS